MNTTTRFFQSKDQYLAFRNAFAAAQKDKRAHKTYEQGTAEVYDSKAKAYKTITTKIKYTGWMSSAHYLLFNLVTGKNYYNGFTPKTKKLFVECGGDADRGLSGAIGYLASLVTTAQSLLDKSAPQAPSWVKDKKQWAADKMNASQTSINSFLEPLGGVFTLQDLARVQLPSFPGLTKEQIEQYKGKPLSYGELYGEQITDQTPDEDDEPVVVATPVTQPVPEKKGLLQRIFS